MTSAVEALAAGNIISPASVVRIAAAAELDLAAAATLLQMESGGGRNVWGRDAVDTGGTYVKGAAVDRESYTAYLKIRGRLGSQGCGPTQLTFSGFQDKADRLGGCWRWDINCRVGFEVLADLIRRHGVQAGFQRYNGAGPAAVAYGQRAMRLYDGWQARLAGADGVRPVLRRGDHGPAVEELHRLLGLVTPGEPGFGTFGPRTDAAVRAFQAAHGLVVDGIVGPATFAKLREVAG